MKEWFSPQELADLKLPALPVTKMGFIKKADKENWKSRPRSGRGGGKEYHISNLPEIARIQLAVMTAPAVGTAVAGRKEKEKAENLKGLAEYAHLDGSAKVRVDAKLEILEAFEAFKQQLGYKTTRARFLFAENYNIGKIEVAEWIRDAVPSVCSASLRNWGEVLENKGLSGLAGEYGKRRGAGIIDSNEEIKNLILGMIYEHPHVSCQLIMKALRARFSNEELPSYRTLQNWRKNWEEKNKQLLLAVQNPDAWRSKFKAASGSADENIVRLNQEWQFDGTPSDILLADGKRYNIVGIIDVWSRRLSLHVCNRATAQSVGMATRKALLKWGVPETVRTDNGKDYVARYIKWVFKSLGIEQIICPPFSPEKKPHIERAFRTFSHDMMELLDGFVGHNVAERKDIEARWAFSERLFKNGETIEMRLTPQELQNFCDAWAEIVYGNEEHGGIKTTPNLKAASYDGLIRWIDDERVLDVLLAKPAGKDGLRVVGKKGVSYEGGYYTAPELGGWEGHQVRILINEQDFGELYVFDIDGAFITKALCFEHLGVSCEDVANARSALQKRRLKAEKDALKMIAEKSRVKGRDLVGEIFAQKAAEAGKLSYMPNKTIGYQTEEMAQAALAVVSGDVPKPTELSAEQKAEAARIVERAEAEKVVYLKETPQQKYARWHEIRGRIFGSGEFTAQEQEFYEFYQRSAEFRRMQKEGCHPEAMAQ